VGYQGVPVVSTNYVIPKYKENCEQNEASEVGVTEHPSPPYVTQYSVTKFIAPSVVNLVSPNVASKCELLFSKLWWVC